MRQLWCWVWQNAMQSWKKGDRNLSSFEHVPTSRHMHLGNVFCFIHTIPDDLGKFVTQWQRCAVNMEYVPKLSNHSEAFSKEWSRHKEGQNMYGWLATLNMGFASPLGPKFIGVSSKAFNGAEITTKRNFIISILLDLKVIENGRRSSQNNALQY